jgi:hypothetical protein
MSKQIPPDQLTAHESAIDEAEVGRFSAGVECLPATRTKLHRGRFSQGLERLPESARKRRPGRYADGVDHEVDALRRGSFAEGVARVR